LQAGKAVSIRINSINNLISNTMKAGKIILPILLLAQVVYCWKVFYDAQFLKYDDNYDSLIHGFIISLAALFILIILWFWRRQLIRDTKVATIIWIIIGSPITFILVALNYGTFFSGLLAG
jgi:hypothetical protein